MWKETSRRPFYGQQVCGLWGRGDLVLPYQFQNPLTLFLLKTKQTGSQDGMRGAQRLFSGGPRSSWHGGEEPRALSALC